MDLYPKKERLPHIILVLSGFLFMGLIILLAKLLGNGPIVPIVFLIGWVVFMSIFLSRFSKLFRKNKNKL
jgi:hypothetical protein